MPSNRRAAETAPGQTDGPRVLKKYPNRRLYDTQTSSYITLTDVKQMVLDAEVFEVRDAKSGEELTRSILLQIILEEESAGMPMFSTQMLAQLIRFYGHTMQGMMGEYMERNLQGFVDLQSRFADQTGGLYEGKAFNPEAWAQFMAVQPPAMQNMMSSVFDQSKTLFTQMQLMQKQAESFFPGMAGFTPPPAKP
ncbi:polyhydroxyalkanoate synthesis repressor PhaR [Sphaerotilus sp.]|jgi:polyhydroxyalkanoate synthesis repressor PhaR|uniref:polyhydroxyalkanoate synthesis repressor PhaR n=1 Tax=Sphaerotilus sp. TaxID=2093942 RepID=UPI0025F19449|nr:polyhydroxyalkanoate synthesis repressor PhaR [Sphaerotilus sp.]